MSYANRWCHRCECGAPIKKRNDTVCWLCKLKAHACRSCFKPHGDVNRHTGKPFTRCGPCRAKAIKKHAAKQSAKRVIQHHVSTRLEVQHDPIAVRYLWAMAVQR